MNHNDLNRPFRIRGPQDSKGQYTWWNELRGWVLEEESATVYNNIGAWRGLSPPTALHAQAVLMFEEPIVIPGLPSQEIAGMIDVDEYTRTSAGEAALAVHTNGVDLLAGAYTVGRMNPPKMLPTGLSIQERGNLVYAEVSQLLSDVSHKLTRIAALLEEHAYIAKKAELEP